MLRTDKCALICDLAEVYSIYDYRSLPASRVATFAVGLRNDSRIKTIMRGEDPNSYGARDLIIANINDMISVYLFGPSKTKSMVEALFGMEEDKPKESNGENGYMVFSSPEEFNAAFYENNGG